MTTPRRNWFRFAFSLRTLFVVVTIFGVWLGWNLKIVRERKAVLAELRRVYPQVWNVGLESAEQRPANSSFFATQRFEYARIPFLRRALGDETCLQMALPDLIEPQLLQRIEDGFPEAELNTWFGMLHRDSLYKPADERRPDIGTPFKTGLIEK